MRNVRESITIKQEINSEKISKKKIREEGLAEWENSKINCYILILIYYLDYLLFFFTNTHIRVDSGWLS